MLTEINHSAVYFRIFIPVMKNCQSIMKFVFVLDTIPMFLKLSGMADLLSKILTF